MQTFAVMIGLSLFVTGCGFDESSQAIDASMACQEYSEKLGIKVSKRECDEFELEYNAAQPEREIKEKRISRAVEYLGEYDLEQAVTCRIAASFLSVPLTGDGLMAAGENANNVSLFWEVAAMKQAPGAKWAELIEGNKLHSYIQAEGKGFMNVAMSEFHECSGRYSLVLLKSMVPSNE